MQLELKTNSRFLVRGGARLGLTPRGRIMIVPWDQSVLARPPYYWNVYLRHIHGPLKGLTLRFEVIKLWPRDEPSLCYCSAYSYPHTPGKGECNG